MIVDHLIVGAGTAGCVLAARLSEDPARTVLVLEAGPDYPDPAMLPEPLRDCFVLPPRDWDWGLDALAGGERRVGFPVGKVVGGTSQTNAAGAWRPLASDFDAWAARGLPAWSWEHVVEDFNAVETDVEYGDRAWHGDTGPVPVTRWSEDELLRPMQGWVQAVRAAGYPACEDMNAPDATGVGINPQSRRGRRRISSADAYLGPARGRENLTVRAEATVQRIALEGDRAVGVIVDGELVRAREVIVCAGVPLSPALLLRSGIGPAAALAAACVETLVDRPGVGRRVMDQPAVVILATPSADASTDVRPAGTEPFLQVAARLESFPGFEADHAFYLCLFAGMPVEEPLKPLLRSERVNWLICADLAPHSLGTVTIEPGDPSAPAACDLAFYEDERDLARMRSGVRAMWALAHHEAFTRTIDRFALVTDKMIADDTRLNGLLSGRTISRQPWGGCAMGAADEAEAVVDSDCRVHGVEGLRVVDASVVPVPLRAGGALATMMLGERISACIRSVPVP